MKKIGILLGGGISNTKNVPYDAKKRAIKAYKMFKKNKIQKLIISGGYTNKKYPKISEAQLLFKFLTQKGIDKKRLILEEKSKDTIGNAIYSKKIIIKQKLSKDITIITSNYHMKRSLLVFHHIFGKGYQFTPAKSFPFSRKIITKTIKEFGYIKATKIILLQIPLGDHRKAETVLRKITRK